MLRSIRAFSSILSSFRQKSLHRLGVAAMTVAAVGVAGAQTAHQGVAATVVYTNAAGGEGLVLDSVGNVYTGFDNSIGIYRSTYSNGSYTTASIGGAQEYFFGLAMDSAGNLYGASESTGKIYKITQSAGVYTFTNIISVGIGLAGIAIDGYGNIYTNNYGNTVYKYTLSGGVYTQHVLFSNLGQARNMAIDSNGVIYQADQAQARVHVYTPSGSVATTTTYTEGTPFTCGGSCGATAGVAVAQNGSVYIGAGTVVYKETPNGSGGYVQSTVASGFGQLRGMAVDGNGNVFVGDLSGGNITKLTSALPDFGSVAVGGTSVAQPITFVIDTAGSLGTPQVVTQGVSAGSEFVASSTTCTGALAAGATCTVNVKFTPKYPGERYGAVRLVNSSGTVIATALIQGNGTGSQIGFSPATIKTLPALAAAGVSLNNNQGITFDPAGTMYLADANNNRVLKISGSSVTTVGTGFNDPVGVALDGNGNLFVVEYGPGDVKMVNATTGATAVIAGGSGLNQPNVITVDGNDNVYVVQQGGSKVIRISATGTVTTMAGTGTQGYNGDNIQATTAQLNNPLGLGVDASGNIYIGDTSNHRVRKVSASSGVITTIAGTGTPSFSGDAGLATAAQVNAPRGQIAIDAGGNVYFSDNGNYRIREIAGGSGNIYTIAGNGTTTVANNVAAPATGMNGVLGMALDGAGNIVLSDDGNAVIRTISAGTPFTPMTFGNTADSSVSAPQTVLVTNAGNTTLTLQTPSVAGQLNPNLSAEFAYGNSSTCTQISTASSGFPIAGGTACTSLISAAPAAGHLGSYSGTLTYTDDTGAYNGATQTITLNAFGVAAVPVVTTLSPAVAKTSTATTFSFAGSGFLSTGTYVDWGDGTTSVANASSDTSFSLLHTYSPAGSYSVKVVSASGPSNAKSVTVTDAPVVLSVSPSSGSALGGTAVTITGTGFNGATSVSFGGVAATGYVINGAGTVITVNSPAQGSTSPVDVVVANSNFASATSSNDKFTYTAIALTVDSTADGAAVPANCATGHTAGLCTLRSAAALANTTQQATVSIGFDSTVFSSPQTITLTSSTPISMNSAFGDSVSINGPTGAPVTIDANNLGIIFLNNANVLSSFKLDYLVLKNGNAGGAGGGCAQINGNVTIDHVTFSHCKSAFAGALYVGNGATVSNSVFDSNTSTGQAGAVYTQAGFTATNTVFSNNTAASNGGVLLSNGSHGNYRFSGCTFTHNTATASAAAGGALYLNDGGGAIGIVTESTFDNNTAGGAGAAIAATGAVSLSGVNNTFTANQGINVINAAGGGSMFQSTFAGNNATTVVGGASMPITTSIFDTAASACPLCGTSATNINDPQVKLLPLGIYGPTTLNTMPPVPGSSAIGFETVATPTPVDERGYSRPSSHYDAGAVQTLYSGSWSLTPTQPLVTNATTYVVFQVTDHGVALTTGPNPPTQITPVFTGAGSVTGALYFLNSGVAAGGVSFDTAGTGYTLSVLGVSTPAFNVSTPQPSISGIAPAQGTAAGGTSVVISGSSFTGVTGVTFGGVPASFVVQNSGQIVAVAPAGAGGSTVDVVVTNAAGSNPISAADHFSYQFAQTITFPQPVTPVVNGSTVITLTATSDSGLPVTYQVVSGPATVSGSTLTVTGVGTIVVEADQIGNGTYAAAAPVQRTLQVTAAPTGYVPSTTAVGQTSGTQTALVTFRVGGTLGSINVLTDGKPNLDYAFVTDNNPNACQVGHAYTAGQACEVMYTFSPKGPGARRGAIQVADASGVALGTSFLAGIGTGPMGVVYPGTQTTISSGTINDPFAMTSDASGNLYVGSYFEGKVYKETLSGGAYTESVIASGLSSPGGLAVDGSGNVWVAVTGSGFTAKLFPTTGGTYGMTSMFSNAGFAVATDASGNVYTNNGTAIVKHSVNNDGTFTDSTIDAGYNFVVGLATDQYGNVFVADAGAGKVIKLNWNGSTYTESVVATGLANDNGIVVDAGGTVYVSASDTANGVLRYAPAAGNTYVQLSNAGSGIGRVNGLTMDQLGNIYVADDSTHPGNVYKIDVTGPQTMVKFPDTIEGNASAAQQVTLYNLGNADLSISSMASPDGQFVMSGSPCAVGGTVASGSACTLNIQFTPHSADDFVGSVVEQDNTLYVAGTKHIINTSGRGLSTALLLLSTSSIPFEDTTVGTTSHVWTETLSNESGEDVKMIPPANGLAIEGANPSEFSFTTDCGAVIPKYSTCHIYVTFHPDAAGPFTATLIARAYTTTSPYTATITGKGVGILATLAPSAVIFNSQDVGATAPTQQVQFTNTSNGTLNVSSIALKGGDLAQFTLDRSQCGATLAPYSSCSLTVGFQPNAAGTFTTTIEADDDAIPGVQTATVTGIATQPVVSVSSSSVSFGTQAMFTTSNSITVTVNNQSAVPVTISGITLGGADAPSFAVDRSACGTTLAAHTTCNVLVTFSPTEPRDYNATMSVADTGSGSPQVVTLQGTGLPPAIDVSTHALDFTGTTVGTSSTQTVTISNSGQGPLHLTGISLTGTDAGLWAMSLGAGCNGGFPVTLPQAGHCVVTLVYTPTAATTANSVAQLVIANDATAVPHTEVVTLTGSGANPIVTVAPSNLSFGDQPVGTTSNPWTMTVNNQSSVSVPLSFSALVGDASNFTVNRTGCAATLAAHTTCTITVTFSPNAVRGFSATFQVNGMGDIALSGNGISNSFDLNPSSVSFGPSSVGVPSASQTITLSNTGGGDVTIYGYSISSNVFHVTGTTCPAPGTVVHGGSCTYTLVYTPTGGSADAGTFTVSTDASVTGNHTVSLNGSGGTSIVTLAPTAVTFANQTVGTTANSWTVTVNNQGGADVTITGIGIVGPNANQFSVDRSACGTTLAAHTTCNLLVYFTPTTAGSFTATLQVADTGTGSPQTVAITGTGTAVTASLSPSSLDFGTLTVGQSYTQTAILQNTSNGTLQIVSLSATNGLFTVDRSACGTTLAAYQSCAVKVTLAPSVAGTFAANLEMVATNGLTLDTALTGVVTAPVVTVAPSSLSFGTVNVGATSNSQTMTVNNQSGVDVTISSIALSGTNASEFSIDRSGCGSTLPKYSTCNVLVTFKPTAVNSNDQATVTVVAAGASMTVAVSGSAAIAPDYTMSVNNQQMTLLAGQTGMATFTMTPINGFTGPVQLSISDLGSGITASFSQATLTGDGKNTPQSSVLTIRTQGPNTGTVAMNRSAMTTTLYAGLAFIPTMLLGMMALRRRGKVNVSNLRMLSLALLMALGFGMVGCGAAGSVTDAGTHTVTVTAKSSASATTGALSKTVTFTLTVKQ